MQKKCLEIEAGTISERSNELQTLSSSKKGDIQKLLFSLSLSLSQTLLKEERGHRLFFPRKKKELGLSVLLLRLLLVLLNL